MHFHREKRRPAWGFGRAWRRPLTLGNETHRNTYGHRLTARRVHALSILRNTLRRNKRSGLMPNNAIVVKSAALGPAALAAPEHIRESPKQTASETNADARQRTELRAQQSTVRKCATRAQSRKKLSNFQRLKWEFKLRI